jgi:glycosyltransferase involved in cell wall biosynthesis
LRILWVSNAPWAATGYGQQTAMMLPRLQAAGHDVAVFANYGLNGASMDWNGIPVYPNGYDPWGNDVIPLWAEHWFRNEPGLIITLYDTWTFEPKAFDGFTVASWTPIDHNPLPPKVAKWFGDSHAYPIAMSRFGEQLLDVNNLTPLYAPHGIDTTVYQPVPQAGARKVLGLPADRFIVGMVAANIGQNPSRKAFDVAFRAFAMLKRDVPDALLYCHTEMYGRYGKGVDLTVLATHYNLEPDDIIFADQLAYRLGAISPERMALVYSAFDVLSAASMGEGFGIPVVEAQACGVPVIVTDFSAQRELVGPGWAIPGQMYYDALQAADYCLPYDFALLGAYHDAYEAKGDQALRDRSRDFAEQYDADEIYMKHWDPILDYLTQVVEP